MFRPQRNAEEIRQAVEKLKKERLEVELKAEAKTRDMINAGRKKAGKPPLPPDPKSFRTEPNNDAPYRLKDERDYEYDPNPKTVNIPELSAPALEVIELLKNSRPYVNDLIKEQKERHDHIMIELRRYFAMSDNFPKTGFFPDPDDPDARPPDKLQVLNLRNWWNIPEDELTENNVKSSASSQLQPRTGFNELNPATWRYRRDRANFLVKPAFRGVRMHRMIRTFQDVYGKTWKLENFIASHIQPRFHAYMRAMQKLDLRALSMICTPDMLRTCALYFEFWAYNHSIPLFHYKLRRKKVWDFKINSHGRPELTISFHVAEDFLPLQTDLTYHWMAEDVPHMLAYDTSWELGEDGHWRFNHLISAAMDATKYEYTPAMAEILRDFRPPDDEDLLLEMEQATEDKDIYSPWSQDRDTTVPWVNEKKFMEEEEDEDDDPLAYGEEYMKEERAREVREALEREEEEKKKKKEAEERAARGEGPTEEELKEQEEAAEKAKKEEEEKAAAAKNAEKSGGSEGAEGEKRKEFTPEEQKEREKKRAEALAKIAARKKKAEEDDAGPAVVL